MSDSKNILSVNEAKRILSRHISKMPASEVMLLQSLNKVLAADVKANIDVPPFDNSAMDGYAFLYQQDKNRFKITQQIQAGDYSKEKLSGSEAVRIFTGAALPPGCDTVIQQELCSVSEGMVTFDMAKTKPQANIRLRGSQNVEGEVIAEAGNSVHPGTIGLLASAGVTTVTVYNIPSVGIIVTGNELQENGTRLKEGHIYNSNEPALRALVESAGIKNCNSYCVKDDKTLLNQKVEEYLAGHDVLILSGGISVGEYDFVREALHHAGVEELFYKVKQKPGKPLLVGKKDHKLIFALPGNPAAVISCFYQYVKPSLLAMIGFDNTFSPDTFMPLAQEVSVKKGLTYFMKAKKENGELKVLPGQDSFNLLPFAEANCLIAVDEETEYVPAGAIVEVYNF